MRRWLLALGIFAGGALPVMQVAAKETAGHRLTVDGRFRATVTLPSGSFSVREVVQRVGKASNAPLFEHDPHTPDAEIPKGTLMIQRSLTGLKVAGAWREAPAAEVLESIALAVNAEWRRVGSVWVLTDAPGLERLVLVSLRNLGDEMARYSGPIKRLTPHQGQLLATRGRLSLEDLTPRQRQALLTRVQFSYIAGDVGPEGLNLHGSYFELEPAVPDLVDPSQSVGPELTLIVRRPEGSFRGLGSFPIEGLTVMSAPSSRDLLTTPTYSPFQVAAPAALPTAAPDLDSDPRFAAAQQTPDRLTNATAHIATEALGQSGVNVVASSAFSDRRLSPGKQVTSLQLFRGVEQATGGSWRKLGNTYVLRTNPLAERIARLQPAFRQEWLMNALGKLTSLLSARQRADIRAQGSIVPDRLSSEQQEALRSAATAAFALDSAVSSDALQLRGVSVQLSSQPAPKGGKQGVKVLLPKVDSTAVVVDYSAQPPR